MTLAWHWQEKYETANPEDASRRQLNKLEKDITFEQWLQAKKKETLANKKKIKIQVEVVAATATATAEAEEEKRIANEKAFAAWSQKKKSESKQLKKTQMQDDQALRNKTFSTSSSTSAASQVKAKLQKCHSSPGPLITPATTEEPSSKDTLKSQQAYSAWLKRKKKEDHIKRKLKKSKEKQKEHEIKLLHDQAFKKKSIVCAYSKNGSSKRIII